MKTRSVTIVVGRRRDGTIRWFLRPGPRTAGKPLAHNQARAPRTVGKQIAAALEVLLPKEID